MGVAFVRQAKENGAMFSSAYINGNLKRKFGVRRNAGRETAMKATPSPKWLVYPDMQATRAGSTTATDLRWQSAPNTAAPKAYHRDYADQTNGMYRYTGKIRWDRSTSRKGRWRETAAGTLHPFSHIPPVFTPFATHPCSSGLPPIHSKAAGCFYKTSGGLLSRVLLGVGLLHLLGDRIAAE